MFVFLFYEIMYYSNLAHYSFGMLLPFIVRQIATTLAASMYFLNSLFPMSFCS